MIRLAQIAKIDAHTVWLNVQKKQNCSDCRHQCEKYSLDFFFKKNKLIKIYRNRTSPKGLVDDSGFFTDQHQAGQTIGMRMDGKELLSKGFVSYMLPLIVLLLFMTVGSLIFNYLSLAPDLGGLTGLLISLFVIVKLGKKRGIDMPKVTFF